ncbi:DUF4331 domain-containing protein [Polaribacter litorisediminis]|uniref:DUF4331 family protein n=1 Tax=Polaribacter litorisediminis TaxID=1908341 RepID=UPI0020C74E3A|nr:DUF4331 family protein [Polaribacter litorisediminis]UAM99510.1 DUF4331 domain-containing protein [Polaribacter litorisediminis]
MKIYKIKYIAIAIFSLFIISCDNNDENTMTPVATDFSGTFSQKDQMGRPAVNTVFVSADSKDAFNVTIPSQQGAMFQSMFETNLTGLSPAYANAGDANALGLDAPSFTSLLATDVLNVSLDGTTTFFDGTNVLTGRALADDVITVELLLIFGGEDFSENPTLSDDHVSANDKEFLTSFPYLASPW